LLLVGKCGVGGGPILDAVERDPVLSQHVTILNDLSDAELRYAFRHARALVYPSLAEGFGLPLVEALSLGLPSFASDLPVFRETSEGYAVFFDPLDPHMLASQLIEFPPRRPLSCGAPATAVPLGDMGPEHCRAAGPDARGYARGRTVGVDRRHRDEALMRHIKQRR
jgi:hypothetical protein